MEEKYPIGWTSATNYLKTAALLPEQRDELISRALEQLLAAIPARSPPASWPIALPGAGRPINTFSCCIQEARQHYLPITKKSRPILSNAAFIRGHKIS